MLSVTLFDVRSTQENPIKPQTIVCEPTEILSIIDEYVDKNHTMLISQVQTTFSIEE